MAWSKKPRGRGMNWRISPVARCQNSASAGVGHQHDGQHVVQRHHVAEGEHAEHVGPVDHQPGQQQPNDREGLQPVPEALVAVVHIDRLASALSPVGCRRCADHAEGGVDRDQAQRAQEEERAGPVQPAHAVVAEDIRRRRPAGRAGRSACHPPGLITPLAVTLLFCTNSGCTPPGTWPASTIGAARLESSLWQVWQSLMAASPRTTLWLML